MRGLFLNKEKKQHGNMNNCQNFIPKSRKYEKQQSNMNSCQNEYPNSYPNDTQTGGLDKSQ